MASEPGIGVIPVQSCPERCNSPTRAELRTKFKLQLGRTTLVFLSLLLVSWLFQYWGHSWSGENNLESDAPAHYVSGLMVHDYVRRGFPLGPVEFAEVFYAHYPKVAIGHWPPMFYVLQAGWMLVFGDSMHSDLVFMAFLSALFAATVYAVAWREFRSERAAIVSALFLLCIPLVQWCGDNILADIPVALFSLWAVLCWANYLDSGRIRSAVAFSSFATLAILTKGNGYAVLFVPPLTILLARRFELLKNVRLWLAAAPIALSIPWMFLTWKLVGPAMQYELSVAFFVKAFLSYTTYFATAAGVLVFVLALVGAATLLPEWRTRSIGGVWLSLLAFSAAEILFHCIVPAAIEPRYLIGLIPCMVLFMLRGFVEIISRSSFIPLSFTRRVEVLGALIAVVFALNVFALPPKRPTGFAEAAAFVTSHREFAGEVILISSEGDGEGPFIARMAELDHARLNHIVLRASHALADSDWNGQSYRLLFRSPAEVSDYLRRLPVGVVVIDRTNFNLPNPHQPLLEQAIAAHPEQWKLAGVFPANASERHGIAVYGATGDATPHHPIVLSPTGTLQRPITIDPSRLPW
jgi:dolichyl-phosphate-mannose-protein mannosyltransferase